MTTYSRRTWESSNNRGWRVRTDLFKVCQRVWPPMRCLRADWGVWRTNVPKEMMEFLNFRHSSDINESYITQPLVLKYLRDFADKFDLEKHIQYYSYVTKVEPHDDRWTVTVRDVKRKEERSECYDAVFICNGSFAHPRMPEVKGEKLFKGLLFHSCDYRSTTLFVNKRVLVVGGSFSAVDISRLIIPVAQKVYISHPKPLLINVENAILKPGVKELNEGGAVFIDGSKEDFDIIMYCTGYKHFYPFLTKECGITVEDSCVQYLYKHVINIERPTLFFIGIPTLVGAYINSDLQARFAVAFLDGKFNLPPKDVMLKEIQDHFKDLEHKNLPLRYFHNIGLELRAYMSDLCQISGIEPFPEVKIRIHEHVINTLVTCKRNTKYVIIDEEQFVEV
ncbi:dimethylaniline monooxygenase [N-oxide-forming] 1-like isoform X2 [Photinus pyralis]|uniref:dimethylaniline monooxygenase [N-oxide-forming] 1-like isoform X2 n=2 Tax=Photinus pyralis TaxID=7054 RepID=UPI0012670DD0|nr:dimethylaniline monooxygenase [N-oxide-forming] 1-like isoform X2 [Photinus pyralis]